MARKIVLLQHTAICDGLTYEQATDALKKATDKQLPDLTFSISNTANGWELRSYSRALGALFAENHGRFVIEVADIKTKSK